MPDIIDLTQFHGKGLQPGEATFGDEKQGGKAKHSLLRTMFISMILGAAVAAAAPTFDTEIVEALMMMGFPLEACQKAAYYSPQG